MAIIELEALTSAAELEVDELHDQLERLLSARDTAVAALARASRKLGDLQVLLDDSYQTETELRAELELAHAEADSLRRELVHARMTADIRGRLLDDIAATSVWTRGKAVRRAARVQRLLARG